VTQHYAILDTRTSPGSYRFWNALLGGWDCEENATIYPADAVEQHWDRCDKAGVASCPLPGEWVPIDPSA